jgi:hypothetical protein
MRRNCHWRGICYDTMLGGESDLRDVTVRGKGLPKDVM